MQILVPMAGPTPFFKKEDYPFPKPLIEIGGKPMIERVVENLKTISPNPKFIFVVRQEDIANFSLDYTLRLLVEDCVIVTLKQEAQGALCSALMAIDHIDEDQPLIVCNGDQIIDHHLGEAVEDLIGKQADAGVIIFDSVHPRWSYVQLDENLNVIQAEEKRVISRNAVTGFYYFATGAAFFGAARKSIAAGNAVNGAYYIAPALNEFVLEGRKVAAVRIPVNQYHSFYSPAKIAEFEEVQLLNSFERNVASSAPEVNVIIPAAGEGSRFRNAGYAKPKPFIDVLGKPMIHHVLDNVVPESAKVHLLLRQEHMLEDAPAIETLNAMGCGVQAVEKLTEGTACTLLLARQEIDNDSPLLVANSDQWVDFSVDDYVQDCLRRGWDGSILVFRDSQRNPKWSFAKVNSQGLVTEVAEKNPISDLATVGIYFFTRGTQFVKAAIDMIARNERVNGEFYTCPVYNYMIAQGLRIGTYEVPENSMHGLGTPEDLELFLDWKKSGETP